MFLSLWYIKAMKNTNTKSQWEALCNYQIVLYSTHQAWVVMTAVINICLNMQQQKTIKCGKIVAIVLYASFGFISMVLYHPTHQGDCDSVWGQTCVTNVTPTLLIELKHARRQSELHSFHKCPFLANMIASDKWCLRVIAFIKHIILNGKSPVK